MADNVDKDQRAGAGSAPTSKLNVEDDIRLQYIGFDVGASKTGELYKNGGEQEKFLSRVREKRERNDILRDTSAFRVDRISGAEKYVLLAASVLVLLTFFLPATPWIAGYFETRTEVSVSGTPKPVDSGLLADSSALEGDSANAGMGTIEDVPIEEAAPVTKDRSGFQELVVKRTRIVIERTPFSRSGLQVLTNFGSVSSDVLSSGIILKITGALFILLILSVFATPLFIIYSVLTIKGDPDAVALQLKKALKFGWYPTMIWLAMLVLSIFGAEYGFDSTTALHQLGATYGMSSFLGLTGSGLYISLAGCMFAGAKSIEI